MTESSSSASPSPASDPQGVLYQEKLYPSWWIWLVALMFAGLTYLVFAPIGNWAGVIGAVVMFIVCTVILVTTTPQILVTSTQLQVGRAGIERSFIGPVTGYRKDDATYQRGPGLHGLAFLCIRGWIDPVVRIQITDERDRTPYWLTSTRNPEKLVAALGGTMFEELITDPSDTADDSSWDGSAE